MDCSRCGLFLVTVVALGRPTILFVTVFADSTMGGIFVHGDLGRSAFMTFRAVRQLFAMGLVVEGDIALRAFIRYGVRSIGQGAGESDQHHSNN
jgi:hypothetical protein